MIVYICFLPLPLKQLIKLFLTNLMDCVILFCMKTNVFVLMHMNTHMTVYLLLLLGLFQFMTNYPKGHIYVYIFFLFLQFLILIPK